MATGDESLLRLASNMLGALAILESFLYIGVHIMYHMALR